MVKINLNRGLIMDFVITAVVECIRLKQINNSRHLQLCKTIWRPWVANNIQRLLNKVKIHCQVFWTNSIIMAMVRVRILIIKDHRKIFWLSQKVYLVRMLWDIFKDHINSINLVVDEVVIHISKTTRVTISIIGGMIMIMVTTKIGTNSNIMAITTIIVRDRTNMAKDMDQIRTIINTINTISNIITISNINNGIQTNNTSSSTTAIIKTKADTITKIKATAIKTAIKATTDEKSNQIWKLKLNSS